MARKYLKVDDKTNDSGVDYVAAVVEAEVSFNVTTGHTHSGTDSKTLAALSGLAKITVGTSAPSSPSVGDLWIDTT